MSNYKIQDFTRCPESSCDNVGPVELDYYWDGSHVFVNYPNLLCSASLRLGLPCSLEYGLSVSTTEFESNTSR